MELIFQSIMLGAVAVYISTKNSTEIWCKFSRKITEHFYRPKCEYLAEVRWFVTEILILFLKNSEVMQDLMRFCRPKKFGVIFQVFWSKKTDDHQFLQINVKRILLTQNNRLTIWYLWSKHSYTALCHNTRYVPNWSHETCSFHPHSVNSFSSFLLLG